MVFTFIQVPGQESHMVEGSKTWNVYTGDFMSLRLLSTKFRTIHQSMLWSPSSYRKWMSPHFYYLQRHNPIFFLYFLLFHYLLVYPIAGANVALDSLTDFFTLIQLQIKSNQMFTDVIAPISTMK